MKKALLFSFSVIILSFTTQSSIAQIDTSNRGTEFWVGYGQHQFFEAGTNTQNMVLYLSAGSQPATVTVTIDSSGPIQSLWWRRTYNVPANAATITDLMPKGGSDYDARLYSYPPPAGTCGGGIFRGKGIHIESSAPIAAYAHIYGSASSGATMLIPVEGWGGLYTSVNSKQSYAANCFSWCYVIAKYDNTVIEVTPSVPTRGQNMTGLQPGVAKTITLMRGQIYSMLGANLGADANGNGGSSNDGYELTGTMIKSVMSPTGYIHPIAVFSGSSRTSNPASCGSGGGDNNMQQHFPRQAWGRKYLTAPFSSGAGVSSYGTATYKVIVTDPTTIVNRSGTILSGLINNTYYQFESNKPELITANKPILVAQFMTGGGCMPGSIGDPEMVYLSPASQAINNAVFYKNTKEGITTNFVTLIIPTAGLSSLRIDNSSTFDTVYTHPWSNVNGGYYSVVVKRWNPATQGQGIIHSDSAFTGVTYGLGSVESYGYNLGCHLNSVNERDASVLPPGFTGEIPLPLTLLSFSGLRKEANVQLNWITSNEINLSHFEVERSLNGNEFGYVGTMQSKQSLQANYSLTDLNAAQYFATNKTLYYRLKMVDSDGRFNYSKVISVKSDFRPVEIQVSPNPFTDKLRVTLASETFGKAAITVRDISGRIILSRNASITQGNNIVEVGGLAGLQNGAYVVEVEMNGIKQYAKVLK